MILILRSVTVALLAGLVVTIAGDPARGDGEKIALDKLPKNIVDAVKAKWPKAELKHASKDTVDGNVVYEVGLNIDKEHLHALLTADGKLFEIHQDIDKKDVPEKVMKAVEGKYLKAKVEGIEKMTDADGKVLGYEVTIEAASGDTLEIVVDPSGTIKKETTTRKADTKK